MSDIAALLEENFRSRLGAYRIAPDDLGKHAGAEELRRTPRGRLTHSLVSWNVRTTSPRYWSTRNGTESWRL